MQFFIQLSNSFGDSVKFNLVNTKNDYIDMLMEYQKFDTITISYIITTDITELDRILKYPFKKIYIKESNIDGDLSKVMLNTKYLYFESISISGKLILPNNIKKIKLSSHTIIDKLSKLPDNLEALIINYPCVKKLPLLPKNLKILCLCGSNLHDKEWQSGNVLKEYNSMIKEFKIFYMNKLCELEKKIDMLYEINFDKIQKKTRTSN